MEHRTLEQVRWLTRHGHAVWLAAPADGETFRRAQTMGLPVVDMDFDRPWRLETMRHLRSFVRDHAIDVIDSHVTRDAKAALSCMDLCALVRSRHVNQPLKPSAIRSLQWRLSDRVITVAECTRKDMIASGLIDAERSVSIGGWADEHFFDDTQAAPARARLRAEWAVAPRAFVVLCVGMLRPDKGQDHLLRALGLLKRRGMTVTCLLAGSATAESAPYEAALRAQAAEEGLEAVFLGYRDDVAALMHAADAVVIPSLTEAQPRVAVQAFATGRPVVATAVGGVPEIVVDGETGRLVPPANSEALADAIAALVSQPEVAARLAAGARRVAENSMRFDQRMAQTLENYALAIDRARTRPLIAAHGKTGKGILHVITTINRGGAENHLHDLVIAQRAAGQQVAVAYLKGDGYWSKAFADAGIPSYRLGLAHYGNILPLLRLASLIHRLHPAVVHAHMPPAEVYSRLALLLGRAKCRYVVSKHNDEPFHHGVAAPTMAQWAAARADSIIAISGAVAKYMRGQGLPSDRIRTIHYGLDPRSYDGVTAAEVEALRHQWGVEPGTMLVGTVGRLVPQKAMHVLLQGFAQFLKTAACPAQLVIVGTGPLEAELKAQAVLLGIADRIVWAGFRTDMATVMASIDVFTLTSAWEGFGLVLLEAMAAGRPIVASRVSAIPEVVAEGESGLLVDAGASEQVAAALTTLSDADLRRAMGQAGRQRLDDHFSVDQMVAATNEVYGFPS